MAVKSLSGSIMAGLLSCASMAQAADFRLSERIHVQKSIYRNIIVLEGDGVRCMTFGRRVAIQGCVQLNRPKRQILSYSKGVLASLFVNPSPKRVLVIGLGGGIVPTALRNIDSAVRIDTVELDAAVFDVAKTYFGFREDARSKIHIDDGRVFVRKQRRAGTHYDLIVIDAYDKHSVPEHLLTQEFIRDVRSLLNPGGVVASNTFSLGRLSLHEAATYQSVFGETRIVDVKGQNRIILAGRDGLPSLATMTRNAALFEARFAELDVSTSELLSQLRAQPKVLGVRPLTDQYSPANLLFDY
jgi:spermidine synthase